MQESGAHPVDHALGVLLGGRFVNVTQGAEPLRDAVHCLHGVAMEDVVEIEVGTLVRGEHVQRVRHGLHFAHAIRDREERLRHGANGSVWGKRWMQERGGVLTLATTADASWNSRFCDCAPSMR